MEDISNIIPQTKHSINHATLQAQCKQKTTRPPSNRTRINLQYNDLYKSKDFPDQIPAAHHLIAFIPDIYLRFENSWLLLSSQCRTNHGICSTTNYCVFYKYVNGIIISD